MVEVRTCTIAASRLGHDLKTTIEYAKSHDFIGTVTGLLVLAQQSGTLEACGVKLEKEPLINAMIALRPENWDVIEKQLIAFGEHAYERMAGPAS